MALKKTDKKVTLSLKISENLDLRLKRARRTAREQDQIFNVSKVVEQFLEKELKKVEKILSIKTDIEEEIKQENFEFEENQKW